MSGLLILPLLAGSAAAETRNASEAMHALIVASEKENRFVCQGELICGLAIVPQFYREEGYRPVWSGPDRNFALAESLIRAILNGENEGLPSAAYHLEAIKNLLEQVRGDAAANSPLDVDSMAKLDMLLTDAFLLNASHLLAGRVNPETIHSKWVAANPQKDLASLLRTALKTGKISETLEDLRPDQPGYRRLRQALLRLKEIAANGGWPEVPVGPALKWGMSDERVPLLRARLAASGDLDSEEADGDERFDLVLDHAVRRFQARHGLEEDGVVGLLTRAELNVSASERARQIELNLERWRWVDRNLGDRYILINIADYTLSVHEGPKTVLKKKVVVGTSYRNTPVFSDLVEYIDINPYWNVPYNIAVKDILPRVQKDPGYLTRNHIRVFGNWKDDAPELRPSSINWARVTPENFSYRLRQDPGSQNALGRIKFMFPNRFSVYLHDTPDRHLFLRLNRDYSSGCIRLEDPFELAAYLLKDDPRWNMETLKEVMESGVHQIIRFQKPVPIHVQYWTAWVGEDGVLQFRYDIYKRDALLARALAERHPVASSGGSGSDGS